MKLTIDRGALLKSLSHVQSVVERRNTIPILSNVRLDAGDDEKLHLTATDMDLAVIEAAGANVDNTIERITAALKESGRYNKTLMVITRGLGDSTRGAHVDQKLLATNMHFLKRF